MTTPLEQRLERDEREKHAFSLLTGAEQARAQLANYVACRKDPWLFLSTAVFTQDQVDRNFPTKPFPSDLEYLKLFTQVWQRFPQVAVPKSRRMRMSWTCISLYLHDTIFNRGRFSAYVSKKEDDAADLVSRAEFIFRNIPEWRIPKELLPKIKNGRMSKQPPLLDFEEIGSKIQGFPMGSDQLRQFTLSGIFGDECAFWDDAQKFYSGSKPTTDGGGRLTLVSSRSPGFFKKIVFDQLDSPDLNFAEIPPAEPKHPIPGIEMWQNPQNRFLVFDCHYSASPEKRSADWVKAIRSSLPTRDFLMEYERSWSTYEGLPVYGDFNKDLHVSKSPLVPQVGMPLLLGWDFGLTPACIVAQLSDGRLLILREYTATNMGITKFAAHVWQELRTRYTNWTHKTDDILNFIDPAGFQRSQVDERTCAQALREAGFERIEPGPIDFEARKQAVEYFMLRQTRDGSAFQLDPQHTPTLTEGFTGGYRYAEGETERQSTKLRPIKDRYSHPHDALQGLAAGARGKLTQTHINIPRPQYGFLKGTGTHK